VFFVLKNKEQILFLLFFDKNNKKFDVLCPEEQRTDSFLLLFFDKNNKKFDNKEQHLRNAIKSIIGR
jgi:hypothetical protein